MKTILNTLTRSRRRRRTVVASSVAVVVTILVLLVAGGSSGARAVAELNVPSGTSEDQPLGSPNDAIRLALIYSELLPIDDAVGDAIEAEAGFRPEITAAVIPNTSLLTVRIVSDDAADADAAMAALISAVASDDPVSSSIVAETLEVASVQAAEPLGSNLLVTVVGGIAVGLALGLSAAIALDRADPLAQDLRDLRPLAVRASRLTPSSTVGLRSLVLRWGAELHNTARVAVLPGRSEPPELAPDFVRAAEVMSADETNVVSLVASSGGTDSVGGVNAVLESDAVALLVGEGSRLRAVREDLQNLEQIGRPVLWIVLVDRGAGAKLSDATVQPPGRPRRARLDELETIEPEPDTASEDSPGSRWTRRQPSSREAVGGTG